VRCGLADGLEVFAGFEADGFAGGDADLGAGAWVAAYAGFAGLDVEDAEAAELDAVLLGEGGFHGVEDGVDGGFGFDAREAGAFDHALDEVLFDHWGRPFISVGSGISKCSAHPRVWRW
jgi:hypothetical protein